MRRKMLFGQLFRSKGNALMVLGACLALLCAISWPAQASGANLLKIGLLEEPKTLNHWLASDAWSLKVLNQMVESLYTREPETLKLVPWLAASDPVYDEASISYTVKLRPAKWSDGSELTSEDIAFTGEVIKEFKVPRYLSRWDFIRKIETPDKQTVIFYLEKPEAVFLERTLTTPIAQKKQWQSVVEEARKSEKPLTSLQNYSVEAPMASGPFVLKEWRKGAYLFLQRNEHFFAKGLTIEGRSLGPFIDGIVFKVYGTSDAAILAIKKGDIDMFWWSLQPGYLEDLKKEKDLHIFSNEKSGLYYMGFNVRKEPFNDLAFRRAMATLIDKDFIITRILQGYGAKMASVVPPGNRYWYCGDVPTYGEGLNREDRVRKAFEVLREAGYTWEVPPVDQSGKVGKGKAMRLPNGQPLADFSILTPPADYDPQRAMAGIIIQEWLREMGMPVSSKPMAFNALIQQVKERQDFDTFILGYGNLSIDPDYVRNFFHSENDKPKGWNMSGYRNPAFDKIADASASAMDDAKRKALLCEMQKIVSSDLPYLPLYNPTQIEVVRTDRFTGWVEMLEGIGNAWSFCQLKPKP
jgi:peptide/nickel transport system substrate-binding protein